MRWCRKWVIKVWETGYAVTCESAGLRIWQSGRVSRESHVGLRCLRGERLTSKAIGSRSRGKMSRKTMPFFGKSVVAQLRQADRQLTAHICRSGSLASPARRRWLGKVKVAKKVGERCKVQGERRASVETDRGGRRADSGGTQCQTSSSECYECGGLTRVALSHLSTSRPAVLSRECRSRNLKGQCEWRCKKKRQSTMDIYAQEISLSTAPHVREEAPASPERGAFPPRGRSGSATTRPGTACVRGGQRSSRSGSRPARRTGRGGTGSCRGCCSLYFVGGAREDVSHKYRIGDSRVWAGERESSSSRD